MDYDQDGRLDLITINLYRAGISASLPYRQISAAGQPLSFVMDWPGSGFEPSTQNNEFAQLADLTGDGVLDLIVDGSPFPSRLYDLSVSPMEDRLIGSGFTGVPNVVDAVFADFDLDGRVDMYLSRDRIESDSEAVLVNDDELRAKLFAKRDERGFSFQSSGPLQVVFPEGTSRSEIRLGASGVSPLDRKFELDASNPALHGIAAHRVGMVGRHVC